MSWCPGASYTSDAESLVYHRRQGSGGQRFIFCYVLGIAPGPQGLR